MLFSVDMKNTDDTTHFDPGFFSESNCRGGWNKNVLGGKFLKN